jgi:hypothetical protein
MSPKDDSGSIHSRLKWILPAFVAMLLKAGSERYWQGSANGNLTRD